MAFKHPFQKIHHVRRREGGLLLAAAGPYLHSLDLKTGVLLSSWPAGKKERNGSVAAFNDRTDDDQRPAKKQKTETSGDEESDVSSDSVNLVTEGAPRVKGQRRKPKKVSPPPNVSHLLATSSGSHVIAVTAEDKCVRVFELQGSGRLKSLTER